VGSDTGLEDEEALDFGEEEEEETEEGATTDTEAEEANSEGTMLLTKKNWSNSPIFAAKDFDS
jgi:hypothetical protein